MACSNLEIGLLWAPSRATAVPWGELYVETASRVVPYEANWMVKEILSSSFALTPAFPGGLMP
jgi:hypothetical protein